MSQDRVPDVSPSDLPEPVEEWLSEAASERGIPEEELLGRLLAATEGVPIAEDADRLEAIEERLDEVEERLGEDDVEGELADLEARIDDLDADLDEKIEDVRDRVIQVKREADGKAPSDHDHPAIEERLDDLSETVEGLAEAVEDLDSRMAESNVADEDVREQVEEVTEGVNHKLDVLAAAVLDLRERVSDLTTRRSRQAVVERLREEGNRNGVGSAKCEACEESIDLSLLTEPNCPHCGEGLRELDPKSGFFGSNVLRTGTPPALEGEVREEDELDGFVEE